MKKLYHKNSWYTDEEISYEKIRNLFVFIGVFALIYLLNTVIYMVFLQTSVVADSDLGFLYYLIWSSREAYLLAVSCGYPDSAPAYANTILVSLVVTLVVNPYIFELLNKFAGIYTKIKIGKQKNISIFPYYVLIFFLLLGYLLSGENIFGSYCSQIVEINDSDGRKLPNITRLTLLSTSLSFVIDTFMRRAKPLL